jgi:parallel beta-helix repeat protein
MQHAEHLRSPGYVLVLVVVLIVGCCLGLGAGPAFASHVNCGDTVTGDTTLDSDLVDCPGNGIVIGADDVTLDLNGHTIDGDGVLGCDEFYACDFGVDNTAGHDGVTIENGSIRDFATAVFVLDASHNRLRRLSSSHNILGGMLIIASPGTRIEDNSISANGLTTDQAGLIVFDSSEIRIERNSVFDNGDIGMFLVGLDDSRVDRNAVSGNPETGIGLDGNGDEVSRNRVVQNGEGITVGGDDNTITRNHVADSRAGVEGGGLGIFVATGHDNLVERNFVVGASRSGIQVSLLPEELEGGPPAVDTVVRRNHLRGNGDGVLVQTTALGTVLERNHALGSGDDGIDVDSAATTLIANHAVHNGDLGIEAVVGVIDGGRNKAHGNGNSLQCTNVACK